MKYKNYRIKTIVFSLLGASLFLIPCKIKAQDSIKVVEYTDTLKVIDLSLPETEEAYYFSHKREIGLDVTGLLAQLTPFNTVKAPINVVGFKTKWYGRKYAFRISFGFDLSDAIEEDVAFAYVSMGFERRKPLGKGFAYVSGWEGIFKADNSDVGPFIGVANFHGIEYNINKSVFLGIETQARIGYGFNGFEVKLLPPTAVYLNIRF